MKLNKKALVLIDKGFSAKTLSKLDESQINVLHSKLIGEAVTQNITTSYNIPTSDLEKGAQVPTPPTGKKMVIQKTPTGIKATPTEEVTEEDIDRMLDNDDVQYLTEAPKAATNYKNIN